VVQVAGSVLVQSFIVILILFTDYLSVLGSFSSTEERSVPLPYHIQDSCALVRVHLLL